MTYDKDSFLAGLAVGRMLWRPPGPGEKPPDGFVTFSSNSEFTLTTEMALYPSAGISPKTWDGILEYSTDGDTWTEWDGSVTIGSVDRKLLLRGTGNTVISTNEASGYHGRIFVFSGSGIACTGNIEMLLDYQTAQRGGHPTMGNHAFAYLLADNDIISAPELPATTLSKGCYTGMFRRTSIATAPELPATTLNNECYMAMFDGCDALVTPPRLPAVVCFPSCYRQMFANCASLNAIPALPAFIEDSLCYYQMFANCTNIAIYEDTGANSFTILASGNNVYQMFKGTSGTVTTPRYGVTYYTNNAIIS